MNLLLNTVLREKKRIDYMIDQYEQELENLPKGTISERKAGEKTYYYLKYRESGKDVSKYIRRDSLARIREQIGRRKQIETMLKSLREERAMARRILERVS